MLHGNLTLIKKGYYTKSDVNLEKYNSVKHSVVMKNRGIQRMGSVYPRLTY